MKHADLYWLTKRASAIDTALNAASLVPGFIGAGAGAVKGVRNLAQGNILRGIGDLALGGAQLFGGGTLIKGIGKGLQFGSKLLGGTRLGSKALGTAKRVGQSAMQSAKRVGQSAMQYAPTLTSAVQRGAQAAGRGAYKAMVPEASQFGQRIVGSGPGSWLANNQGKVTLGGMGAFGAGEMREAGQAAAQAHDQGIINSMQSLAQASQTTTSNPIFQQQIQPPGSYMMGPGAPMWG